MPLIHQDPRCAEIIQGDLDNRALQDVEATLRSIVTTLNFYHGPQLMEICSEAITQHIGGLPANRLKAVVDETVDEAVNGFLKWLENNLDYIKDAQEVHDSLEKELRIAAGSAALIIRVYRHSPGNPPAAP